MSAGPTDVEVSRSLNALVTTLNDWKVDSAQPDALQRIVTGVLAGEARIRVRGDGAAVTAAELTDPDGTVVGRIRYADGRWLAERVGAPLTGAYIPRGG
jgi:hypothetical protein